MKRLYTALAIFIIVILLTSSSTFTQPIVESCNISVYDDGYALVSIVYYLSGSELNVTIKTIGEVTEENIIIVLDEDKQPLLYEVVNESYIRIYTLGAQKINLTYFTPSLTEKEDEIWTLKLNIPVEAKIILPKDSIIIGLSDIPNVIDVVDEKPLVVMPKGDITIEYIIPPPIIPPVPTEKNETKTNNTTTPPPLQTNTTETQNETSTTTTSGQNETQQQETTTNQTIIIIKEEPTNTNQQNYIIIAIIVAILIIASILFLKLRKRTIFEELDYDEIQILETIKKLGGKAFQSDVAKIVDLPSTTLWRNIRKLEEKGYLKIEKRYGRNYLILK